MFTPAYMASITMLVPADDRAVANSMVGVNEALAGILGPALGGLLLGAVGHVEPRCGSTRCTFAVSLLLVAASRVPMPVRIGRHGRRRPDHEGMFAGLHLLAPRPQPPRPGDGGSRP